MSGPSERRGSAGATGGLAALAEESEGDGAGGEALAARVVPKRPAERRQQLTTASLALLSEEADEERPQAPRHARFMGGDDEPAGEVDSLAIALHVSGSSYHSSHKSKPKLEMQSRTINASALSIPSQMHVMPSHQRKSASTMAVRDMVRKLGLDPVYDSDLLYLAEEVLHAPLPDGWVKHVAPDGAGEFFYNAATKTTQWTHPMEAYYQGLVFMIKEGDEIMEQKARQHPPRPEEVIEMAKYFGIDVAGEPGLLDIAKAAVSAPLPPDWDDFEDEDHEVYFYNRATQMTSHTHPLDGYFLELVRAKRKQLNIDKRTNPPPEYRLGDYHTLGEDSPVPYEWVEYLDPVSGAAYWYNHADDVTSFFPPYRVLRAYMRMEAVVRIQAAARGYLVRKRLPPRKKYVRRSLPSHRGIGGAKGGSLRTGGKKTLNSFRQSATAARN